MAVQSSVGPDERVVFGGSRLVARADEPPGPADWGVLAAALALQLGLIWRVQAFITDDAFISLRYARNLADGYGPVWNPGGPAVEGYSNPLLVLLEAAAFRLAEDGGIVVARGLGVLSAVGLVVVIWRLGRPVIGPLAANAAALVVAGLPALAYWSVGGLETLPIILVMTTSTLLLARDDGGSAPVIGVLLATLPWLRPEGLALAAALVFFSEITGLLRRDERGTTLRRLAWLAGIPLVSQVALQALRWVWFGHLVPNSVIYKTGTGEFGEVTAKFLMETTPILALAAAGFFLVAPRAKLLAVIPAVYLVAGMTFRDSVNTFSRLVLPALPLLAILAAAALPGALTTLRNGRLRRGVLGVAAVGLAGVFVVVGPVSVRDIGPNADGYMECRHAAREQAGSYLADTTPADTVIAMGDAGVVPFTAQRTTLDLFGLNEAQLQELGPTPAQFRADQALAAAPDRFVLASRDADEFVDHYSVERRVQASEGFEDAYSLEQVTSGGDHCGYHLFIYARDG